MHGHPLEDALDGNPDTWFRTVRFQIWGDERLLWDSGLVAATDIVKPQLDIRGIGILSLRTSTADRTLVAV